MVDSSPSVRVSEVYLQIVEAFLKQIRFYESFPQTSKCGQLFANLYPEIVEYIIQLKDSKSINEIIEIVLDAFQNLVPKIKHTLDECNDVPQEVQKRIKEIIEKLSEPEYISNLIKNAVAHYSDISTMLNAAKESFEQGNYELCGENIGSAFNILFMLD